MDVASVISGLEKMLKMGIVSSSTSSNVHHSSSFSSATAISDHVSSITLPPSDNFPTAAGQTLLQLCLSPVHHLSDPEVASIAMIGGYIVRVMTENWNKALVVLGASLRKHHNSTVDLILNAFPPLINCSQRP
ncbi:hypothetical protein HPB50_008855 [Hyalomma asiaticum]|uniref:Uncharacterized protein n=1 Tax=Hyalomma asiaticum TaxID=266040 RepID=A0ACB7T0B7_HYAAI|nr:hypothetical protein HPB50_008855 [Hyalomma asiaticum]